jgi:hypothetical protein
VEAEGRRVVLVGRAGTLLDGVCPSVGGGAGTSCVGARGPSWGGGVVVASGEAVMVRDPGDPGLGEWWMLGRWWIGVISVDEA